MVKGGIWLALSPGHIQILSHGCEIKSGSGLGTRLVFGKDVTFAHDIVSFIQVLHPFLCGS